MEKGASGGSDETRNSRKTSCVEIKNAQNLIAKIIDNK